MHIKRSCAEELRIRGREGKLSLPRLASSPRAHQRYQVTNEKEQIVSHMNWISIENTNEEVEMNKIICFYIEHKERNRDATLPK